MEFLVAGCGLLVMGLLCLGTLLWVVMALARWCGDLTRTPTPEEVKAKAREREIRRAAYPRISRKVGLFVLGLVTPGALSFALETLYRGNAPWEWLWSLAFAALWVLARPSYAAATATFVWIGFFFSARYFAAYDMHGDLTRDEYHFYMPWSMGITLTALALGIFTAIAGTVHAWLARRRSPA